MFGNPMKQLKKLTMKKYKTCEICSKKAIYRLTPDLDIQGLGACEKHKQDMQIAYIILTTEGEKEYREFIESSKKEVKK